MEKTPLGARLPKKYFYNFLMFMYIDSPEAGWSCSLTRRRRSGIHVYTIFSLMGPITRKIVWVGLSTSLTP